MPRYKLELEYDGTKFKGWQKQKEERTLQGTLEDAAKQVFGTENLEVQGAGRTDAGVHALSQIAHIEVDQVMPADKLTQRLNGILPQDLTVLRATGADPRFHARLHALHRSYVYVISTRRSSLFRNHCWHVREGLAVEKMKSAAQYFKGFHDFSAFCQNPSKEKSTLVNMDLAEVVQEGSCIFVHFTGSHFLWKQVRRMVGILVGIGLGELEPEVILDLLKQPSTVLPAKYSAPSQGLFLERIYFQGDNVAKAFKRPIQIP